MRLNRHTQWDLAEALEAQFRAFELAVREILEKAGISSPIEEEVLALTIATYYRHRVELTPAGHLYGHDWPLWFSDQAVELLLAEGFDPSREPSDPPLKKAPKELPPPICDIDKPSGFQGV